MSDTFKGRYTVGYGYIGGSARSNPAAVPHHFTIRASDLSDDMTDLELENLYYESAQEHFEQHITCETDDADEFVAWARARLAKGNAD